MNELTEQLQKLGFTQYASQVLESLYILGAAKATDLSTHSGVPKAKIYTVLDELVNKRLIRLKTTKPASYAPLPPKEFFKVIEERETEQLHKKLSDLSSLREKALLEDYYKKNATSKTNQEFIEVISLGAPTHNETKRIINAAKNELYILTEAFGFFHLVQEELINAINRGVAIHITLTDEKQIKKENIKTYREILSELKKLDVAITICPQLFKIRFVLNDPEDTTGNSSCIFVLKEYHVPLEMRGAVFTKNPGLVEEMYNLYKYHADRVA